MTKWLIIGLSTVIGWMSLGCGGSNQLVEGTLSDAVFQIAIAKEVNAETLASQELADAEQMLNQAETALKQGHRNLAYRFGIRAYLKAKLAESIAIMDLKDHQVATATKKLEAKLQAADTARRAFEEAKNEFEKMQSTSP